MSQHMGNYGGGLMEMVTDMWMVRVLDRAGYGGGRLGYAQQDIVGDVLIKQLSEYSKKSAEAVQDLFLRDKIAGTKDAIRLTNDYFRQTGDPRARMRQLLKMPAELDFADAVKMIDDLGLPLDPNDRKMFLDLDTNPDGGLPCEIFKGTVADKKEFGDLLFDAPQLEASTAGRANTHAASAAETGEPGTQDPGVVALYGILGTLKHGDQAV